MDRLQLMETFVRVVETGSFSGAAKELDTTQPVVSKHIRALEQWLGVPLLVRSTRRQATTEAGQRFYQRCCQILDMAQTAQGEAQHTEHDISGQLTVTASVTFGSLHIVPRLAGFYARYPRLKVHLVLDDAFVDLIATGTDIAFRLGQLRESRLVARRIGTGRRLTVASVAYLAEHGEPQHPSELAQHECLVYSRLAEPTQWAYQTESGQTLSVTVNGRFVTSSSVALSQALREGLGICYTTEWNLFPELRAGTVKPILTRYSAQPMPLHVVYQPSRRPSLKVKAFVDYFMEAFQADSDISQMMMGEV